MIITQTIILPVVVKMIKIFLTASVKSMVAPIIHEMYNFVLYYCVVLVLTLAYLWFELNKQNSKATAAMGVGASCDQLEENMDSYIGWKTVHKLNLNIPAILPEDKEDDFLERIRISALLIMWMELKHDILYEDVPEQFRQPPVNPWGEQFLQPYVFVC